jgi:hypothetical protein
MLYTVYYKQPGGLFWRKLKRVKGDTIYRDDSLGGTKMPIPVRVLILEDETRLEIPCSMIIRFSRERFFSIKQKMESEAGQAIPTK